MEILNMKEILLMVTQKEIEISKYIDAFKKIFSLMVKV